MSTLNSISKFAAAICCYNAGCKSTKLMYCSNCLYATYCSRECQHADEKVHSMYCAQLAEIRTVMFLRECCQLCYKFELPYIPSIILLLHQLQAEYRLRSFETLGIVHKMISALKFPIVGPKKIAQIQINTLRYLGFVSNQCSLEMTRNPRYLYYRFTNIFNNRIILSLKATPYQTKIRNLIIAEDTAELLKGKKMK